MTQHETGYLIHKAGRGWYRPGAAGYTLNADEAGRFTRREAISHSRPNGPTGPRDGLTFRHESEVPARSNCKDALRIHELTAERDALREEREQLLQALSEATSRIETLEAEMRGAESAMDSFARTFF